MPTYVAMLRGINVGGHNKVRMADLRDCLTENGLTEVQTYIQSGNVVFQSKRQPPSKLSAQLEEQLEERFGFTIPVIVRLASDLKKQMEINPYLKKKDCPNDYLYFVFADKKPKATLVKEIEAPPGIPETFEIVGDVIYLRCPNGTARSKLTIPFFEKQLKVRCTARNWKTVNQLKELSSP